MFQTTNQISILHVPFEHIWTVKFIKIYPFSCGILEYTPRAVSAASALSLSTAKNAQNIGPADVVTAGKASDLSPVQSQTIFWAYLNH